MHLPYIRDLASLFIVSLINESTFHIFQIKPLELSGGGPSVYWCVGKRRGSTNDPPLLLRLDYTITCPLLILFTCLKSNLTLF